MHRQIIDKVLESLDSERAGYFFDVVTKIEEDRRTARYPNYVYLLLKETILLLPTYLDKREFLNIMYAFIDENYSEMKKIIFDKEYIYDQTLVQEVTNGFVVKIVDRTLELYEAGEIETGEAKLQKFTWPYRKEDLIDPDVDENDEDEMEVEDDKPPYSGPERRKRS